MDQEFISPWTKNGILTKGNAVPGQAAVQSTGEAIGPNFSFEKTYNAQNLKPAEFTAAGGEAQGLKYSVELNKYPADIGVRGDLQHYMVFFINVREKSKYLPGESQRKEIQPQGIKLSGQNLTAGLSNLAGTIGGAGAGAFLGLGISSLIKRNFGIENKAIDLALTAVGAVAGGAGGSELVQRFTDKINNAFGADKTFRISDAIMLAVNEKPSVKYGVDYDGRDLGTLIGALAAGGSALDILQDQRGGELARLIALNVAKVPQGLANILGQDLAISDALQVGTGLAPNPFREQVFRNVETRTFRFDYRFFPRNRDEAEKVKRIIHKFKLHMHPELSQGGLFYVYPSTFDIAYYFNGRENPHLHRISTCVLERVSVDYGGSNWHTFHDGMPTEINMSLEFRELERLTKERIDQQQF
jgi:hypothetical protein